MLWLFILQVKMISLFYVVIIITFFNANVSKIVYYVAKSLRLGTSKENLVKRENVRIMLAELSEINMTDEWAKYAKLQRKINKEKDELNEAGNEESSKIDGMLSNISWTLRGFLTVILTLIVLFYRNSIVAQLPDGCLWPFQTLICWCNEFPGGITTPSWIVISSSVARTLSRFV